MANYGTYATLATLKTALAITDTTSAGLIEFYLAVSKRVQLRLTKTDFITTTRIGEDHGA